MLVANSQVGALYAHFWQIVIGFDVAGLSLHHSIEHWVNDGLMAIFFLFIGLEIEREIYVGELSSPRNATLPIVAAIGGMVIPAIIHFGFNHGTVTQVGVAIPMATDIAFALGILGMLGKRVPVSLKIFLTALAIIDDLGAIIIIALFYGGGISWPSLIAAFALFSAMVLMNRLGIRRLPLYLIPGLFMWYFMLKSGIHATIAGVLLAFAIPFKQIEGSSPSARLEHTLQWPVAFLIMPVFALANTCIDIGGIAFSDILSRNGAGVFVGLVLGKPVGIVLFSLLAVCAGVSKMPEGVTLRHLIGAGCLGGIGFTMSIFITLLAFPGGHIELATKLIILLSSLVAGSIGFAILRTTPEPCHEQNLSPA